MVKDQRGCCGFLQQRLQKLNLSVVGSHPATVFCIDCTRCELQQFARQYGRGWCCYLKLFYTQHQILFKGLILRRFILAKGYPMVESCALWKLQIIIRAEAEAYVGNFLLDRFHCSRFRFPTVHHPRVSVHLIRLHV